MVTFSERNDTLATATPTGLSANNLGRLSFSGEIGDNPDIAPQSDVDLFKVQLDVGDRLTIDIEADIVGSSLDSILRLFAANGNEVAVNDDDFGSLDSLINFTAVVSDTYFIGVSGYSNFSYDPFTEGSGDFGSTGEYSLEITLESPLHMNRTIPLRPQRQRG
ncbi:MAG: PPC domain-containing protein [Cyanophyceae cyanobacterium]